MPKQDYYTCPRCNYETNLKKLIKKHFDRKTNCKLINDISLTDDIKEFVLINKTYIPPKQKTINNNYIVNMNIIDKLDRYIEYCDKHLVSIENKFDTYFEQNVNKLENDSYKYPYILNQNDILEIFNNVTQINGDKLHELNIIYDDTLKKIKMKSDDGWGEYMIDVGITAIVRLLQSYFFNFYELYLIKKLHQDGQQIVNRCELLEHLEIYYEFIATYNLSPSVVFYTDKEILGHIIIESNDNYLKCLYIDIYNKKKKGLKESDIIKNKKKLTNILKYNTIHNINEFNKIIFSMIKCDEQFQKFILKN